MATHGFVYIVASPQKASLKKLRRSAFSQNPLEVLNVTITNREIEGITEKGNKKTSGKKQVTSTH